MDLDDAGYNFLVRHEKAPTQQGFFSSAGDVEHWVASGNVSNELLSFVHGVNLETERIFVYTHTHSGSGMDDPTAKVSLKDGLLDVTWFDQCTSGMRTCDLCFRPLVVAIRLDTNAVKSVHVHGTQITTHTFIVDGVTDEARALTTLRGIDEFKAKGDDEMKALTSISTQIADRSTLQALAYLPKLEELRTTGVHWTPETLELLGKLVSLKKLRVGGRYWAEPNNFRYSDLKALTNLTNLESLDLSYSAVDGAKAGIFAARTAQVSEKQLSLEFAKGMKTILKFPKLKELILKAQMYPKGAKLLTSHPTLEAILCVKKLSYDVVQALADSRLATQLISFEFEYTRNRQLAGPIIAQIAKFVNLTHLGMRSVDTLNDAAMAELAPLVKLRELYLPHSNITSEGLKVLRGIPLISVLSLGYCRGIENGLDHISHLSLTHLDVRSIRSLTAEQLLPVIRASPNLVDLNLRYAQNVDAGAIAKQELKQLQFFNALEVGRDSRQAVELLEATGAKPYFEDDPFHIEP